MFLIEKDITPAGIIMTRTGCGGLVEYLAHTGQWLSSSRVHDGASALVVMSPSTLRHALESSFAESGHPECEADEQCTHNVPSGELSCMFPSAKFGVLAFDDQGRLAQGVQPVIVKCEDLARMGVKLRKPRMQPQVPSATHRHRWEQIAA